MTVFENDYAVDGAGPEDKSGKPRLPFLTAFHDLPLHRRFAIVGGIVSLIGMVLIGAFVNSRIETAVVRNSAISAAVYMESLIAPLSQELADGERPVRRAARQARGASCAAGNARKDSLGQDMEGRRACGLCQRWRDDRSDIQGA